MWMWAMLFFFFFYCETLPERFCIFLGEITAKASEDEVSIQEMADGSVVATRTETVTDEDGSTRTVTIVESLKEMDDGKSKFAKKKIAKVFNNLKNWIWVLIQYFCFYFIDHNFKHIKPCDERLAKLRAWRFANFDLNRKSRSSYYPAGTITVRTLTDEEVEQIVELQRREEEERKKVTGMEDIRVQEQGEEEKGDGEAFKLVDMGKAEEDVEEGDEEEEEEREVLPEVINLGDLQDEEIIE